MVHKMKSLIIVAYTLATIQLTAKSWTTAEMVQCTSYEMALNDEFISQGKELPRTWDAFALVQLIKKGTIQKQLFQLKTTNSFALVPGAPVIASGPGIPYEYANHRLFLISRHENITKQSQRGRYAILVKQEGVDEKPIRTWSYFIPEETAQLILNQFNDFDPQKQPLAFEKAFVDEVERSKMRVSENLAGSSPSRPKNPPTPVTPIRLEKENPKYLSILWSALVLIFLVCAGFGIKHLKK